jgi:hypothetical protein
MEDSPSSQQCSFGVNLVQPGRNAGNSKRHAEDLKAALL